MVIIIELGRSIEPTCPILLQLHLFVIDDVEVVNQFLEFGVKVQAFGVVHQIEERGEASVGFDGVRLILFGAWGVGVSETLNEDVPAFFGHERIVHRLLRKEGIGLGRDQRAWRRKRVEVCQPPVVMR